MSKRYSITSITAQKTTGNTTSYYCVINEKKSLWLKSNQIIDFQEHYNFFTKSNLSEEEKRSHKVKDELEFIFNRYYQKPKNDEITSVVKIQNKVYYSCFSEGKYKVFTLEEIRETKAEELINFFEKNITV